MKFDFGGQKNFGANVCIKNSWLLNTDAPCYSSTELPLLSSAYASPLPFLSFTLILRTPQSLTPYRRFHEISSLTASQGPSLQISSPQEKTFSRTLSIHLILGPPSARTTCPAHCRFLDLITLVIKRAWRSRNSKILVKSLV